MTSLSLNILCPSSWDWELSPLAGTEIRASVWAQSARRCLIFAWLINIFDTTLNSWNYIKSDKVRESLNQRKINSISLKFSYQKTSKNALQYVFRKGVSHVSPYQLAINGIQYQTLKEYFLIFYTEFQFWVWRHILQLPSFSVLCFQTSHSPPLLLVFPSWSWRIEQ